MKPRVLTWLLLLDEKDLIFLGYGKTPDVRFEIPILVDGKVIYWIESKATFGCRLNHPKYLDEQYWSYRNRYGPGLVIYASVLIIYYKHTTLILSIISGLGLLMNWILWDQRAFIFMTDFQLNL